MQFPPLMFNPNGLFITHGAYMPLPLHWWPQPHPWQQPHHPLYHSIPVQAPPPNPSYGMLPQWQQAAGGSAPPYHAPWQHSAAPTGWPHVDLFSSRLEFQPPPTQTLWTSLPAAPPLKRKPRLAAPHPAAPPLLSRPNASPSHQPPSSLEPNPLNSAHTRTAHAEPEHFPIPFDQNVMIFNGDPRHRLNEMEAARQIYRGHHAVFPPSTDRAKFLQSPSAVMPATWPAERGAPPWKYPQMRADGSLAYTDSDGNDHTVLATAACYSA